jgi:hypothetical protein
MPTSSVVLKVCVTSAVIGNFMCILSIVWRIVKITIGENLSLLPEVVSISFRYLSAGLSF